MRLWLGLFLATTACACVTPARVILPADAPIAGSKNAPPLEVGDHERRTADNPFSSDAVVPCRDEEDRASARQALEAMGVEIYTLHEGSTAAQQEQAVTHLKALLDTPCFALAKADLQDPLEFDSAVALRTWWTEGSGENALAVAVTKEENDSYPSMPIAGQPRPSLLLAGHERHPLAPLLCEVGDTKCGLQTSGWIRRTRASFERTNRRDASAVDCEKTSQNADPEARWSALVECAAGAAEKSTVLPLGRFRPMSDGYFVVTSPAWSSCAAVEVFDLSSGTMIRSSPCRGGVSIGQVPLATIREAAFMTAISSFAKDDVRDATSFNIPENVAPGRTRENAETGNMHLGGIHHGGPQFVWTWYRPRDGKLVPQVTGVSFDAHSYTASRYAFELVRLATASMVEGCAPSFSSASLASIPWNQTGPMTYPGLTIPFDFDATELQAARKAIPSAKAPKKCAAPM